MSEIFVFFIALDCDRLKNQGYERVRVRAPGIFKGFGSRLEHLVSEQCFPLQNLLLLSHRILASLRTYHTSINLIRSDLCDVLLFFI